MTRRESPDPFTVGFKELEAELALHDADPVKYRSVLDGRVDDLLRIARQYHPCDLIGHFALANTVNIGRGEVPEFAFAFEAHIDYLASLLCAGDLRTYNLSRAGPVMGDHLTEIERLLRALFSGVAVLRMTTERPSATTDTLPVQARSMRVRTHFMLLKHHGHHAHVREALRTMFASTSAVIERELGFSPDAALRIGEAATGLYQDRVHKSSHNARDFATTLRSAVGQTRRKHRDLAWTSSVAPQELIRHLATLAPSSAAEVIERLGIRAMFHAIGEALTFDVGELSSTAKVSEDSVRRYLDAASIPWGHAESTPDRLPSQTTTFDAAAFVRIDGRYFLPRPALPCQTLLATLDKVLKPAPGSTTQQSAWNAYTKARSHFLESGACELLGRSLRANARHTSLSYSLTIDGKDVQCELDGLIVRDKNLVLIEAKAGRLTPPARRGGEKRLQKASDELHGEALHQVLRARHYIEHKDGVPFTLPGGEVIVIRRSDFEQVFLIVVTLEETDPLLSVPGSARLLGISDTHDIPWFVSYFHLKAIAELVEFPTQLIHFLTRRRQLAFAGHVVATDETDWFGAYQTNRLQLPHQENEHHIVVLEGFGDPIEDYFITTLDEKRASRRPQLDLPPLVKQLVVALDRDVSGEPAICWLLDQRATELKRIEAWLHSSSAASAKSGADVDCTMLDRQTHTGVTLMCGTADNVLERLRAYCTMKKYTTRAQRWIGIALSQSMRAHPLAVWFSREPWTYNDQLESLRASFPTPQVDLGATSER